MRWYWMRPNRVQRGNAKALEALHEKRPAEKCGKALIYMAPRNGLEPLTQ